MDNKEFKAINVVTGYDNFKIRNVTTVLEPGDMMALLGKSGSGKSTIIKTFLGIMEPLDGSIWFKKNGEVIDLREIVGYSPQENALYEFLTVKENLRVFGELRGMDSKTIRNRQEKILKQLDIFESRDKRVDELSGGMKKRADLSVSLIHEPELIVLDEPFAGIDPPQRDIIWDMLSDLSREGRIVIITSHNISSVIENCNKYCLIKNNQFHNNIQVSSMAEDSGYDQISEFVKDSFRV